MRRRIRSLASPVRQEIIDTLESLGGEAAVAQIAAQMGRPADGLYYHLRQLVKSGLLHESPDDSDGRRYRTAAARGERLWLRYGGRLPNVEPVARVVAGLVRMAERDFGHALRSGRAVGEGEQRDLWAARNKGWVSAAELGQINRLLTQLSELMHQPRSPRRDRLLALAWVMAPIDARPLRRGEA